jgi:hypothetical protein
MVETVFMSLTLVLLVYIAYIQHKSYMYTQYILVATAKLMTTFQEAAELNKGEENYGETQRLH